MAVEMKTCIMLSTSYAEDSATNRSTWLIRYMKVTLDGGAVARGVGGPGVQDRAGTGEGESCSQVSEARSAQATH